MSKEQLIEHGVCPASAERLSSLAQYVRKETVELAVSVLRGLGSDGSDYALFANLETNELELIREDEAHHITLGSGA